MRIVHIGCGAMFLLLSGVIAAPGAEQATALDRGAGTWKTWVISSGKDFRVPPPPDRGATEKEAVEVRYGAVWRFFKREGIAGCGAVDCR